MNEPIIIPLLLEGVAGGRGSGAKFMASYQNFYVSLQTVLYVEIIKTQRYEKIYFAFCFDHYGGNDDIRANGKLDLHGT